MILPILIKQKISTRTVFIQITMYVNRKIKVGESVLSQLVHA